MNQTPLQQLRIEIDKLDAQLVSVLAQRMKIVAQIGEYKKQNNIPPLDMHRWQEVLLSKKNLAVEVGISPELIEKVFTQIHEHALEIEK